MKTSTRETVEEKAARLKGSYRVIQVNPNLHMVIGDHSTYQVSHVGAWWVCNCPWGRFRAGSKACSHVQAAQQALADPTSQGPVAPLAAMLAAQAAS